MRRTPSSKKGPSGSENDMEMELDVTELQQKLQQQERLIRQLQERQEAMQPANMTSGISTNDFSSGNYAYISIRDALEAVPNFDGENIAFNHFVEGCEEALSMIAPSQEIILVRAVRNKLKGDAHRSILGKVFNSLQSLVEFLRNKYGPRETVYEAQARLAYICQKDDERISAYANRVRDIGKRIIDAQKRQSSIISQDFKDSIEEHLKVCFLRGLNPEIKIMRGGTFEELESRAIDAERELETVKTIRQVVLGERIHVDNKRTTNAPMRRVGTEPVTCQYCHKTGHTADRCRYISGNQPPRPNFPSNANPRRTNFSTDRNYNNTRISQPPSRFNVQNSRNISQITCNYCKKTGHEIANCRKLMFNNQSRNHQMPGNGQNPAKTGAAPGTINTRPARTITTDPNTETAL